MNYGQDTLHPHTWLTDISYREQYVPILLYPTQETMQQPFHLHSDLLDGL